MSHFHAIRHATKQPTQDSEQTRGRTPLRVDSPAPVFLRDHPIALAFGSNLGQPEIQFAEARRLILEVPGVSSEARCGGIYLSEPVDCPPGSPLFSNTALQIRYTGILWDLFICLQQIEADMGRAVIRPKNSPRPLDIDLIHAGESTTLDALELTIPHPRAHLRDFVLRPLADITPGLRLPGQTLTVRELLDALPTLSVLKPGPQTW